MRKLFIYLFIYSEFILSIVKLFSLITSLVVIVHVIAIVHLPAIEGDRAVRKAFPLFFLLLLQEFGLVVGLIIYLFKNWKALFRSDASFAFQKVDHDAVGTLLNSLPCEASFFCETTFIAKVFLICEVIYTVKKLASLPVHTVAFILILTA